MAKAGWYPDPAGSAEPRYWDGARWTDGPSTPGQQRRGAVTVVAVGLALVLLLVGAVIWQPWNGAPWAQTPEDTRSAKPTGSQWDERLPSPSTPEPEPTDDGGRPKECPIEEASEQPSQGGWFHSGPMKFQGVPGWGEGGGWTIDFATERGGNSDSVGSGWVAVTAIGQISKEKFSATPKAAAQQLIDCMSTSYYYKTLDHKETLESRAHTTSDGVKGWLIRENFWNEEGYPIIGDEIVVVVLESGDEDRMTLFHTQAPIDDDRRKEQVAEALSSLQNR